MTNKAQEILQKLSMVPTALPGIDKAVEGSNKIVPIATKELGIIREVAANILEPVAIKSTTKSPAAKAPQSTTGIPKAPSVTSVSGEPMRPKMAGVVDRTVKEIAELQYGYRFQRNPWAEANDSQRSRNWINYEGPGGSKMASKGEDRDHCFWCGAPFGHGKPCMDAEGHMTCHTCIEKHPQMPEKSAGLKEKVEEGLKDETEGHKYWMNTSKLLNIAGMKPESQEAAQKAGQEDQHHAFLERIKTKMNKKAELEKEAFIRHEGGKFNVYSHSGKHMGSYASEGEAKHRLQQIEYFKKHGSAESQALFAKAKSLGAGNREAFPFFAKGLLMERAERAARLPIGGKGLGPELQKQPLVFNTLEKGGSIEMRIYQRNRKTLLA